ncbi:MAG: hypothetical protein Q9225_003688 [Loekoesia sp. 1 TL-2023]
MTPNPPIRPRVFLDAQSGADFFGRIIIELFSEKTPRTCENFRLICASSHTPQLAAASLTYKGSPFHRVINEFMIQGGDITAGNGTGGTSIYGENFEDENLGWRQIDAAGLVCMANRGKNTNSSQFFITLASCEHLDGKHTVFGHVVKGMDVCERMAKVPVDRKDRPLTEIIVSHCGELERRPKPGATAQVPAQKHKRKGEQSQERSNGKVRHYSSSNDSTTSSKRSQSPRRRKYRKRSRSPRRRSDTGLDENRRGRTSTRSISPDDSSPKSPPRHRHHRRRSSPPSRSRSLRRSRSPHLRRRPTDRDRSPRYGAISGRRDRDIEDEYDRNRRQENQPGRRNESEFDYAESYGNRVRDGQREHNKPRQYDDGRLGGVGVDNEEEPEIKFKGRGSMKYRERRW